MSDYPLSTLAYFTEYEGRKGVGIIVRCPNCGAGGAAYFANPLDGGSPPPYARVQWQRTGDTLETLSLSPSFLMIDHYHSWIRNGMLSVDSPFGPECERMKRMNEEQTQAVAPTPAPTDPTPAQVPGPPPAKPEPVAPTVKANPTPEQVEEARQYVVSKGYSYAAATQIVTEHGALNILDSKASEGVQSQAGAQGVNTTDPGELVPGRITVRVFDYDTRKSLHIMEQRDAGTEFDVYVRTR
jgi:hypothetical protein